MEPICKPELQLTDMEKQMELENMLQMFNFSDMIYDEEFENNFKNNHEPLEFDIDDLVIDLKNFHVETVQPVLDVADILLSLGIPR